LADYERWNSRGARPSVRGARRRLCALAQVLRDGRAVSLSHGLFRVDRLLLGGIPAMSVKSILVPVDYSACSRAALRFALDLAQRYQATLDVVHVWDRPSYVSDVLMTSTEPMSRKSLIQLIQENAQRDLDEFLSGVELPPGTARGRLLSGDPASTLLKEIKHVKPDLVVVGTHGRTGLTHVLLGSVAEKLARLSPVPVMIVPDDVAQQVRS
jgi:universal stress protein A